MFYLDQVTITNQDTVILKRTNPKYIFILTQRGKDRCVFFEAGFLVPKDQNTSSPHPETIM